MTNAYEKSYEIVEEPANPMEFVPARVLSEHEQVPPFFHNGLMIDTIHDGTWIPRPYWEALVEKWGHDPEKMSGFEQDYVRERDWGADSVAAALVDSLNRHGYRCPGYHRVTIARVLLDFGRFPGYTRSSAQHLDRFAINYPFSHVLSYDLKKKLLENYYDAISDQLEPIVPNKIIKLAIHTYDRFNEAGTERPLTSVINRPMSYQLHSKMPVDFFDPMFPSVLGEYTAERRLIYRLALMLERAGFPSADNYPYLLPSGSIEVRAQVWMFFHHLRQQFLQEYPETEVRLGYRKVWAMLLDTNLRSAESENLRSYLHMFRKAPQGEEEVYEEARLAYETIQRYLRGHDEQLVWNYRKSPRRPNCLGIEIRKDYVWEFADKECRKPLGPNVQNIQRIADVLAQALVKYMREDRSDIVNEGSPL